jgi:hypothetical protein
MAVSISSLFVLAALGHQPGERDWARLARRQQRRHEHQEDQVDVHKHKEEEKEEEDEEEEPRPDWRAVLGKVGKVFRLLTDPRMYLLSVSILYLGLQQGFIAADVTKHIILPTQGLAGIPMVLICFCTFDGLGCFLLGKLSDKLGKMIFIIVGVTTHLAFYVFYMHKCWSTGNHESVLEIDTVVLYISAGTHFVNL